MAVTMKFETTEKYRKDIKRLLRQGVDLSYLDIAILTLLVGKPLEAKLNDQALSGDHAGLRECHIKPDWVLIYAAEKDRLVLTSVKVGA
jgi:mRNA interferase YafQ